MVQLSKTSLPFMIDIHCKQECEQLEIRPISFSTFFKGLSAGNFKTDNDREGRTLTFAQNLAQSISSLVDKLLTRLGEMLRSQRKPDMTPGLMRKAKKLKGKQTTLTNNI